MAFISEKDAWYGICALGACILIGNGLKRILPINKEQQAVNVTTTVEKNDTITDSSIRAWGLQEKSYFEGKQLIDSVK